MSTRLLSRGGDLAARATERYTDENLAAARIIIADVEHHGAERRRLGALGAAGLSAFGGSAGRMSRPNVIAVDPGPTTYTGTHVTSFPTALERTVIRFQ